MGGDGCARRPIPVDAVLRVVLSERIRGRRPKAGLLEQDDNSIAVSATTSPTVFAFISPDRGSPDAVFHRDYCPFFCRRGIMREL
jgi:hypothetical protein